MTAAKTTRLLAYYRVSKLGDRDIADLRSIDQQQDAVAAIVKLTPGAEIVGEPIVAMNASGGKSWPEPKLAEAIAAVDAGEADGIVVYALDRWGRHMQALQVIERWAQEGKTFLSASDKFDATTPQGRVTLRMMMTIASYYWELSRERFALSRQRAVERGVWVGPAPTGYQRDEHGGLVVDERTGPAITEAFEVGAASGQHAAGDVLRRLIPEQKWKADDVRRILSRRAYLGEHHDGAIRHEPLTTLANFQACQVAPRGKRSNGDYPLSGIATCAGCGAPLTGGVQSTRGKRYRRYRCSNANIGKCHAASGGCGSILADGLESHVRELLADALSSGHWRAGFDVAGVEAAQTALEAAEAELARYVADVEAHELLGDDAWRAGMRARQAAVDSAREQLQKIAGSSARTQQLPGPDQLDDPVHFQRALAILGSVVVAPAVGRRGEISERVAIDWAIDPLDDSAGVLAA